MKLLLLLFIYSIKFEIALFTTKNNNNNNNNIRIIRSIYKISVFYDDTHFFENLHDLIAYTVEANNHLNRKNSFQFEYTITKVKDSNAYRITEKLCEEINSGRIAVLTIGNSKVFEIIK